MGKLWGTLDYITVNSPFSHIVKIHVFRISVNLGIDRVCTVHGIVVLSSEIYLCSVCC